MLMEPFPYQRGRQDLGPQQQHLAFATAISQQHAAPKQLQAQLPVHANGSVRPPPGLGFPQTAPALLPSSGHTSPTANALFLHQQLAHQPDLTQYVADLTQAIDRLADAAKMAELSSSTANPSLVPMAPMAPVVPNMSLADLQALSCLMYGLQNTTTMTPPFPNDSAGKAFGPPGLALPFMMRG